jgi:imidazolonepropionase
MLLIENIGTLATLVSNSSSILGEINDAAVLIDREKIFWCGKKADLPKKDIHHTIDAAGQLVTPGLIDCHSHLIFAGLRADEFAARMHNESYHTIMKKGGGILSTVHATKNASDDILFDLALKRADQIISNGVTTLEAKSGYGLNLEQELRALSLLKKLDEHHQLDIHRTFLGAHIVPNEYKNARARYLSLLDEMLERIQLEKLAIDCDVFCDIGAFTVEESKRILSSAHARGFGLRAHVQQLSPSGGISLVRDLPIKSVSHADFLSKEDIEILAKSDTVVETLPIAALFLRSKQITPVKELFSASVKLAIATDFNPGSAMCHDLTLAARLGVTYFLFSVNDALRAITINAAKSLGRHDIGTIEQGKLADLLITNCRDVNEFFYDWTKHPAQTVIKRGLPYMGLAKISAQ